MNKADREKVEQSFMRETAYDLIMGFIDKFIFPNQPGDYDEDFSQKVVRTIYRANLDIVFQFAESPIEKIFLNALLLENLMYGSYLIKYTEPLSPVNEVINTVRSNYEFVMQMWQDFQMASGDEDAEEFLAWALNLPNVSSESKEAIVHHVLYGYLLKHVNAFHISLQCVFDDITVNGKNIRPDIFIWVPSRPEFKLIVECDGFRYHSDQEAFLGDRARDRVLQSKGYQVFRFSGYEIVNDPIGKAKELFIYLATWQNKIFRNELLEDSIFYKTRKMFL